MLHAMNIKIAWINFFRADERNPKNRFMMSWVNEWGYTNVSAKHQAIGSDMTKFAEEGFCGVDQMLSEPSISFAQQGEYASKISPDKPISPFWHHPMPD
jgi:hypothetical protein